MKAPRIIAPLAAAAALLAAAPAAHAGFRSIAEPMQFPGDATIASVDAAPGTWLVGARPGAGARSVASAFGARAIGGGDYVVERSKARAMAGALRSRGLLLYAQPDAIRQTQQAVPDDPLSGPPNAWRAAVADPNIAPPAVTGTSPLIALLDTRLDETHPEFAGSNIRSLGNRPLDNLHGTATAAVAAAPQNGVGILGVWPGARALNVPLPPDALTCSASARGVREAIRDRAAVINMSYGSQSLCRAEYNAIQLAVHRGIVPVAAAGNEFDAGNPLEFPASLPHVLTIAAVNARLNASSFSNSNPAVDPDHVVVGLERVARRRRLGQRGADVEQPEARRVVEALAAEVARRQADDLGGLVGREVRPRGADPRDRRGDHRGREARAVQEPVAVLRAVLGVEGRRDRGHDRLAGRAEVDRGIGVREGAGVQLRVDRGDDLQRPRRHVERLFVPREKPARIGSPNTGLTVTRTRERPRTRTR